MLGVVGLKKKKILYVFVEEGDWGIIKDKG